MLAYRIVKTRHALTAFSGDGAREYGGRWNRPGTPMVYAAQTRALAALESLPHFAGKERGIAFVVFEIEVPDELVMRLSVQGTSTEQCGSEWQRGSESVALLVPSALIPQESCLLLNPEHPDTSRVMIGFPEPFEFDTRL